MKRLLKYAAALVIVLAIPAIIQKVMLGPKQEDAKKTALVNLANEQNATLPKRMDAMTTLTKVEYDQDVWRVHYTMDKGAPIDPFSQKTYRDYAVKQICGGSTKMILEKNITIEYLYSYTSSSGDPEKLRISIPPGSC